MHIKLGRVVKPPVLYMKEYSSNQAEGVLSTIHQNYYTQLCKLDEDEKINIKIKDVGKLKEFVGCKIKIDKSERTAKFTQPVLIQSF